MSLFKALGGLAAPTSSANNVGMASGSRSGGASGLRGLFDATDSTTQDAPVVDTQPSINPDPRGPSGGYAT